MEQSKVLLDLKDGAIPSGAENIFAPKPEAPLVPIVETREQARERIAKEMDERDEEQILADLQGLSLRYVQRFVYAYCARHKDAAEDPLTGYPACACPSGEWVVDLTYGGIKEAANKEAVEALVESITTKRGKLLLRRRYEMKGGYPVTVENSVEVHDALLDIPDFVEAHAFSRRDIGLGRILVRQGFSREPMEKNGRNGKYANEFAEQKAVGKAVRNAQKQLISQLLFRDWIDKFLGITSGEAGGITASEKPKSSKNLLGSKLAANYGEQAIARKAFEKITAAFFFAKENKEEPGSKFYTSLQQIDEAEAGALLEAIESGKIILPAKETLQ